MSPTPDPCSECGRKGVVWFRVVSESTGAVGWRWRCRFCKYSRLIKEHTK